VPTRPFQTRRIAPRDVGLAVWIAAILASLGGACAASAGDENRAIRSERERFFEQSVRPLLAENCYSCHSDKKQKGGLRLDSLEAILKGGESGPAVVPGKPDESLLVEAINYEGPEMPPTGKLAPEKVAVLTRWVSMGAPWPAMDRAAPHAIATAAKALPRPALADQALALWSFQPLRRPTVPDRPKSDASAINDWSLNPIDRFIARKLHEHQLNPSPEADRATLIRRVTFDLTGLPPSPDEIDAFLGDEDPGAYERLVDRLLASPRYGQRWARHWLDLVRYAESDGYRQDAHRPAAWRYRDYVVRSFNSDKPYNRFVTEQLAGDEVDPDDPELRIAAGYLRLGTYEYNQRNVPGQWADMLNDITDVTGEVFLGLSIGCARCHDHKFDPILQNDYYRLQAFFTPLLPRDDLTLLRTREWREYQARQAAWETAAAGILRQMDALEKPYRDKGTATALAKFPDDIKAILAKPDRDRTPLERQIGALAYRQISYEHELAPTLLKGQAKERWTQLQQALKRFDAMRPAAPGRVHTATDVGPIAPPTVIPGDRKQVPVEPGFLTALEPGPARVEQPAAAGGSTGRRLALARWLCRPDQRLATRVIVNRIWQYHFGRGLAGTSSDFGRLGEPPSHPPLLDWLATEMVARGWQLKPMHRLILTSAVYRQASRLSPEDSAGARRVDPENRLLWKQTVRRLDAEEIRDAMLASSGELGAAIGGPSAPTTLPRRTIDTRIIRNTHDALLDAFDAPDGTSPTARRNTTTTATQALLLVNGDWTLARAGALAGRLERARPSSIDEEARILLAYRLTVGRQPTALELAEALLFLDSQAHLPQVAIRSSIPAREHASLVDFCHVLLNSNEFLYVD
jgi:hypothetical protein